MMQSAVIQQKKPFYYRGKNKVGEAVSGIFYCFSEQRAKLRLRKQKVSLNLIYEKQLPTWFRSSKISHVDITMFLRQLSTMVDASMPLLEGLRAVRESAEHVGVKNMLSVMILKIDEGHSLGEAMSLFPDQFDKMTVSMVETAGQTGILPQVLARLAEQKEKQHTRIGRPKRALIYPMTMLTSEIILLAVMLLFVVPPLQNMYTNLNAELPLITEVVIGMSTWLSEYWLWMLASIVITVWGLARSFKRSQLVRENFQRLQLKIKGIKHLVAASATSQLMHSLSTQVQAGIPILQALRGAVGTTGNVVYDECCEQLSQSVERGDQLSEAMARSKLFPEVLVQMTKTGEQTGDIVIMVDRAVQQIDEDVENKLDAVTNLFETFLVVSLSVSIGLMVVAMYLPIFKLGGIV